MRKKWRGEEGGRYIRGEERRKGRYSYKGGRRRERGGGEGEGVGERGVRRGSREEGEGRERRWGREE